MDQMRRTKDYPVVGAESGEKTNAAPKTAAKMHPVLYAVSAAALAQPKLYASAYASASPSRRERTDRLRFDRDKYLSLSGEALLRYALRQAHSASPMDFVYGPQGKPSLKDDSVQFSLSHSGDWALCAVAGYEVGCDVERIVPDRLKIARRFFSPEEYAALARQSEAEEQALLFCRFWTLKESFLKATGLGMTLPLNAFRIVFGEEISVQQSVDGRDWNFAEFADLPGYCCALCAAETCQDAAMHIVSWDDLLSD